MFGLFLLPVRYLSSIPGFGCLLSVLGSPPLVDSSASEPELVTSGGVAGGGPGLSIVSTISSEAGTDELSCLDRSAVPEEPELRAGNMSNPAKSNVDGSYLVVASGGERTDSLSDEPELLSTSPS